MITLSEAFKLCGIGEEAVYLRHVKDPPGSHWSYYFWSKKIRDKFDMKKVRVIRIETEFEHFGPEFLGFRFVVDGMTQEELKKLSYS